MDRRIINTNGGNYNEKINGNYVEKINGDVVEGDYIERKSEKTPKNRVGKERIVRGDRVINLEGGNYYEQSEED